MLKPEREAVQEHELLLNYERRCQAHDEYFEKRVAHLKELKQVLDFLTTICQI